MDDARLSMFPHHSWLTILRRADATHTSILLELRRVNHWVVCSLRHSASVRNICRASEICFEAPEGSVRFAPQDSEKVVVHRLCEPFHEFSIFLIPDGHLRQVSMEEGFGKPDRLHEWIRHGDAAMFSCIRRLVTMPESSDSVTSIGRDELARRLVCHLLEASGGGRPDWHADSSLFDRRTLDNVVAYIDEHLRVPPSLSDMSMLVGMSPSHCARKFRLSTGLSLHRFINRRRIRRAIALLETDSFSPAEISFELGFSSQSHFNRVFSELTGGTPAKYGKQYRQTVN